MNATLSVSPATGTQDDAALLASKCEQEKADLARLIHDGLAQQLTVASLELSLWHHEIETAGAMPAEAARAKINNLSALVSSMVGTARSISGGLRPRSLDSFGLAAAIEGMVGRLGTRLGGGCRFEQNSEQVELPAHRAIHLYRVLESLFNAIDKAPAEGVVVTLQQIERGVVTGIVANPLPQLPAEAAARLRIFKGQCTVGNGMMTIQFPC